MGKGKIDFIMTWVDGNDEDWLKEKSKFAASKLEDDRNIRFRNWDNLEYWFRGVENFAPWVNKIYFVTWGHIPDWLNTDHPKLEVVNHKDFIPEKNLPTFSSHTIELNLHRIDGLSEQFVYFNDDIFITNKLKPEDFFKDGLPRDNCVLNAITPRIGEFSPILNKTVSIINKNFSKKDCIKKNFFKWFNLKYGKLLIRTMCMLPWKYFTGFYNPHLAVAYKKETFEEVWAKEHEVLERTCSNKFRNNEDVNQYIFRYWRLVKGEFSPSKSLGRSMRIEDNNENIINAITQRKYKLICINDAEFIGDFESAKQDIIKALDFILPKKSSYEL